jgi:flagellin-like protein
MNSKAISPMIATILLIAFTVAVGAIISVWLMGYTRTTGAAVSGVTENQTICINSYPNILMVTDKAIILSNPGSEAITNLRCFAGNGSALWSEVQGGFVLSSLAPGNLTSFYWSNSTGSKEIYNSDFGTRVVCSGSCRNIGVTGECNSGQFCWKIS